MAEFGGSLVNDSVEAEVLTEEADPDMSGMTRNEIELEEIQPRWQSTGIMET